MCILERKYLENKKIIKINNQTNIITEEEIEIKDNCTIIIVKTSTK